MIQRRILDSHIHLWDPGALDYPFLKPDQRLDRPFLPEHLRADGGPAEWIVVQAEGSIGAPSAELDWMAAQAVAAPEIRGFVVRAPVEIGTAVRSVLEPLAEAPLTVGVRRLIQDEPFGFAESASFIDGVRAVGELGLPFDICTRAAERQSVFTVVDACQDVTFVLDHLGKPDIDGGEWDGWRAQLGELARRHNVTCKLSGAVSEGSTSWSESAVRPYLDYALDAFGADRCMFGSDWPPATLTTSYTRWLQLVAELVAGGSPEEIDAVFAGTAERVYALTPRPPAQTPQPGVD